MAAGDKIFYCRAQPSLGSSQPTTAVTFGLGRKATVVEDPGAAGTPRAAERQVSNQEITVSVDFFSMAEAMAWLSLAAANFVGRYKGAAGANEKVTVKNVVFTDGPDQVVINAKDAGGKIAVFRISGTAQWGTNDTLATMVAFAADS